MNYLVARVSDEKQRKALPAQKRRLLDYANRKSWVKDKDFVYKEYDETAFKDNRVKFQELVIEPLQNEKELAIVVFDKIDRFSRDSTSEERAALTRLFRKGKIEMHFPSDNLFIHKGSPASDLFRLDIGVALAGYYSSAIRDNVKRRFDQMIADGIWVSKAPIGYVNYIKGYDAKGDPIKDIKVDEDRAHHIIEGFKLRSTGMSYGAIAKDRKVAGLRGHKRRGQKEAAAVNRAKWEEILNNPFYMGKMRYLGQEYKHNYPRLIEPWLWDKCQAVRDERAHARTKYRSKPFLFKRLKCAECGCTVSFDGPKGKGGNIYGRCTAYTRVHEPKWVNEKVLIEQVKEVMAKVVIPKQKLPKLIAEIERHHASEQEYYVTHKQELQKEYDKLDIEVKELFEDRKQFKSRPDIFEQMVKERETRQKVILQELDDHSNGDKAFVIGASYILEVCSRAVELFEAESSNLEQKRYLLDFVLSNMKLNGEKLEFNLRKPFDAIVKMQKTGVWCG
jgi:DNA invertase Pin-like site-specific DNA recombinase